MSAFFHSVTKEIKANEKGRAREKKRGKLFPVLSIYKIKKQTQIYS